MTRRKRNETMDTNGFMKWKIALYIRLSREDGNEISVSVGNQKRELQTFLETFDESYEIIDYYCDDGFTGTDSNRVEFQRMLSDINTKKVNCVIVRDPSRLSRNYLEAGMYMEQLFVQHNVRFISLALPALDSYKNPESMNSIAVPIQNVINDDFCRQTSLKIRGVFNMKRSRGEFIGAFAPYGYLKSDKDKSLLVIDPEASLIVKDIFHWFVFDGMSKGNIVRKLNQLGILNPSSYKKSKGMNFHSLSGNKKLWCFSTVVEILSNEMYTGNMVQGRYRVKSYKVHEQIRTPKNEWFIIENTHEPIIDKKLFESAQRLHQKDTRVSPNNMKLSLFAGFLKCADCGKGMRKSTGKTRVYYSCRTNKEQSKEACTRHSIRQDVLEDAVLKTIQSQISLVNDMQDIIGSINNLPNVNNKSERLEEALNMKKIELSKILTTIDNLYMDWRTNEISHEDYTRMRSRFVANADNLKKDIQNIKEELSLLAKGVKQGNSYFEIFLKYKNIQKLDRGILTCLIDRILVHEDKHITVVFNYQDQYLRMLEFIDNNKDNTKIQKSRNQ